MKHLKVEVRKRLSGRFPYYYTQDSPLEFSDYRYIRTFYLLKWAVVIKLWSNEE